MSACTNHLRGRFRSNISCHGTIYMRAPRCLAGLLCNKVNEDHPVIRQVIQILFVLNFAGRHILIGSRQTMRNVGRAGLLTAAAVSMVQTGSLRSIKPMPFNLRQELIFFRQIFCVLERTSPSQLQTLSLPAVTDLDYTRGVSQYLDGACNVLFGIRFDRHP